MKHFILLFFLFNFEVSVCLAQNPIIRNQFTADPTAKVFNGRVYLFPSHDIISPVQPEKRWFSMADYHMFSSTDLVEWTDYGVILSQEQVPWGNPKGYSMWAPDCVTKDGKYYFFFPDAPKEGKGFGAGVAIADNLFRPKFVPQNNNIKGIVGIDPCVLQTSNGENYIFWGGGGLRVAKLKPNLLELADEELQTPTEGFNGMKFYGHSIEGLPEGFKEGPFAFEHNGKFYLTYPWVRHEGGTECLAYAMSDNPMGPYEYKGIIMQEHANGCWTNHHSIVEFKGQWYLFYHHNDYSPSFDKNRSVCIDSLFFNPDGTIQEVKPTLRGVGITDARKPVQIDRYSDIGGGANIDYHDTLDCFKGWKTIFPKNGSWVTYNRIEVKSCITTNLCLRVRSKENAQFSMSLGKYVCQIDVPNTKGEWQEVNISIPAVPEGINDLKLTCLSSPKSSIEIDWLSLTEDPRPVYFKRSSSAGSPFSGEKAGGDYSSPDENGFIRRWMLLEPIDKPNRSNTVFTDTYLRENLTHEYFKGQFTCLPKDGDKVEITGKESDSKSKEVVSWHALESTNYNVKLFRFATGLELQEYGALFNAVTIIECPEDIPNVRLAIGSNGASMWWLNGEEVLLLSGDRRMVKDDASSQRLTLKKGKNILRGVVINGPGMSDFCARFIDESGKPVVGLKIKD